MLRVNGDVWDEAIVLGWDGTTISRTFGVSAGRHRISLRSDGAAVIAPPDSRQLVLGRPAGGWQVLGYDLCCTDDGNPVDAEVAS